MPGRTNLPTLTRRQLFQIGPWACRATTWPAWCASWACQQEKSAAARHG